MQIGIGIHVAESRAHRLVHKQQVRKLIPCPRVFNECIRVFDSVRAHLHQCAVHAAATRPAIEPDDCPGPLSDMLIREVPKEEIAVVCRVDGDVSIRGRELARSPSPGFTHSRELCLPAQSCSPHFLPNIISTSYYHIRDADSPPKSLNPTIDSTHPACIFGPFLPPSGAPGRSLT